MLHPSMQAQDTAAVRELLACTAALRPKHLDAVFLHRRRTRAGTGRASQQWYVGLNDWVAGTAADAAAAPAFFEMQAGCPFPVTRMLRLLTQF